MAENIVKKCSKCPTWVISTDGERTKCPNCDCELIKD